MQNNKEQKAVSIVAGWLFLSFLLALFLFGAIKRFHGPNLSIIPWGQYIYTAWLAVIGGTIHCLMFIYLSDRMSRSYFVSMIISLVVAIITFLALTNYYAFQSITDYSQPEALVFFYLIVLSVSVGHGVTALVIRRKETGEQQSNGPSSQ